MTLDVARAIFAVPPFPRSRPHAIIVADESARANPGQARAMLDALRNERVGGPFWHPDHESGHAPGSLLARVAGTATDDALLAEISSTLLNGIGYRDPFTGEPSDPLTLIAQLGYWRRLIESNRGIEAAFGFARWKRDTVEPLLWHGEGGPAFRAARNTLESLADGARVACWKARVPRQALADMEARLAVVEVEDGFIRSIGLGADCVPPLSIVVDDLGVHYDPSRPSRLEEMIEAGGHPPELIARAADLRAFIVRHGVGKYGVAGEGNPAPLETPENGRVTLVVGQVEDDRSVRFGSPLVRSNLALLEAARRLEPDAHIIYRPHPDVTAGHRAGAIPRNEAEALANAIDAESPISDLIARSDALHTMTSLAGFEALLRGREVICHGQPFYAGWGLTRDLAPTLPRRTARPTLDALVAAVLLLYPRYLDPVTNLPCTPEILLSRLMAGVVRQNDALVPARRLQGMLGRAVARMSKSI